MLYVYAVIASQEHLVFDEAGVDDDHDVVYTIPHGNLAAVVSESASIDYRGLRRDQAVRHLVVHQRVVEAVMEDFPVLPMKFGTVLPDESAVRCLLERGKPVFEKNLEEVGDKVQMEVVVLWKTQEVFQAISQEEPVKAFVAGMAGRAPQPAERVALGQMVQSALVQHRRLLQAQLLSPMQELSLDAVLNPPMDDSMVLNVALLVEKSSRAALEERLMELDRQLNGRLTFRCVGPLPPYSFATVEVEMPSFEAVDAARRQLGLGDAATQSEIKHAYHLLAAQWHPDHNRQGLEAEARMAPLAAAYRLLMSYTASQAMVHAGGGRPAENRGLFSQKAVANTLLIAVRRQEVLAQ